MLDLYVILEGQNKPPYPEQAGLEYAGSLDDLTFHDLQKKGLIELEFHYYSDFRWSKALVKQKYDLLLEKSRQQDTSVSQLLVALDKALKKNGGIIGYCD